MDHSWYGSYDGAGVSGVGLGRAAAREIAMLIRAVKCWVVGALVLVVLGGPLGGCNSTAIAVKEKLGIPKRDQLVARVKDARDGQQEAKEQFAGYYTCTSERPQRLNIPWRNCSRSSGVICCQRSFIRRLQP